MEELVPIFAIFCTIGLPVLALMTMRVLKHRERMEMIRNGMAPDTRSRQWAPPPGSPIPPPAGNPMPPGARARDRDLVASEQDGPEVTLRKGIKLAMIGLALVIGLSFIGGHPGPWLLFGLIPLFVGLSQVLIAVISGASLGPIERYWTPSPPPPPPFPGPGPVPGPSSASGPQTYEGSYTYRPGDHPELQPPLRPPDRR